MHNYDFAALSDYEFEQLSGYLLQAELSLTLERFARGRDSGIDLRVSYTNNSKDIFQCKHYLRSGYSKLLSTIKGEVTKVRRMNPRKYFLITSVDLTPKNKEELMGLLTPYCQLPNQIFGAGDLNNLLIKFPEIEKNHFKLWLSSIPVLEKILHSRIISESESEVSRIQDRISKYVVCGQFPLAIDLLKRTNVCIVSGPPGVGKTTLAEIVLAHFLRDGYACIKIPLDISDARALFRPEEKQIFYYDDFLGKTSLSEKLGKNEDDRIVRFIKDIQKTKASKFILTTREYILRKAQGIFEGFRHASIDIFKLVLEVTKYSTLEKAKILYNHLYFSSLPRRAIYEMALPENYKSVILHKNYNPRIIEFMTDIFNLESLKEKSFPRQFLENLDQPTLIWVTAFKRHIGSPAQNFLLTLLTLQAPVSAEDLDAAFSSFQKVRAQKYHQSISPYDFRDSLRELDGSFIRTEKCRKHLLVRFHNPSVMDFLENHFRENPQDIADLSEGLFYPDQISGLYSLCEKVGLQGSEKPHLEILKRLKESFLRKSVRLIRHTGKYVQNEYWDYYPVSKENRLWAFLCNASKDFLINNINDVISIIEIYQGQEDFLGDDLFDLIGKVEEIIPTHPFFTDRFLPWAKTKLLELANTSSDLRDFKGLSSFFEKYHSLNPDELEKVKSRVEEIVNEEISYIEDERPLVSEIEDRISELKSISETFQMNFDEEFDSAIESAIDPEYPEDDEHDYGRGGLSSSDCSDKEGLVLIWSKQTEK